MPKWGSLLTFLNAVILGVLLQFRNRESYDRWWEARRVWGNLVSDSRNLCMKISAQTTISVEDRGELGRLVVGFAVSLKASPTRGKRSLCNRCPSFAADPVYPMHIPLEFARRITVTQAAALWRDRGDPEMTVGIAFGRSALTGHVRRTGRVRTDQEHPTAAVVPIAVCATVWSLYLISCPWLVFDEIGWWGLPPIGLLTYFLLGIEFTAEDVEEPFGRPIPRNWRSPPFARRFRQSVVEVVGNHE